MGIFKKLESVPTAAAELTGSILNSLDLDRDQHYIILEFRLKQQLADAVKLILDNEVPLLWVKQDTFRPTAESVQSLEDHQAIAHVDLIGCILSIGKARPVDFVVVDMW